MSTSRYRLGVDVGGTHTDLVLLDTATRRAYGREGLEHAEESGARRARTASRKFIARGVAPAEIGFFAHGTTITTNALLEMRGAKVGLLITKGYRAVQEVQNQARDGNLFDYFYSKPAADRAAEPDQGNPRTLAITPATCCCRSIDDAVRARRARPQGRRRRVDRGLLPVLVHESGARGTRRARSSTRSFPASTCRCRARCCRASANGRGSRPRCSTPISSR